MKRQNDTIRIFAIKFLDDGWTLLNNSIMVRISDGKLEANYDKNLIEENTAILVINKYLENF